MQILQCFCEQLIVQGIISFCWFTGCYPKTIMKMKMIEPPPGAMKALLQTLFLLIHRSEWIHTSSCSAVIDAKQSVDEALKVWKPEADQARTVLSKLHSHSFGL